MYKYLYTLLKVVLIISKMAYYKVLRIKVVVKFREIFREIFR